MDSKVAPLATSMSPAHLAYIGALARFEALMQDDEQLDDAAYRAARDEVVLAKMVWDEERALVGDAKR